MGFPSINAASVSIGAYELEALAPLTSPTLEELRQEIIKEASSITLGSAARFGSIVSLEPSVLSPIKEAWKKFDSSLQAQFFSQMEACPALLSRINERRAMQPCIVSLSDKIQYMFLLVMKECLFLDREKTVAFFQEKANTLFTIESFAEMDQFCRRENQYRFFSIFPNVKKFLDKMYTLNLSEQEISYRLCAFLQSTQLCDVDIREISFRMFAKEPTVNLFFTEAVNERKSHDFPMKLTSVPKEIEFVHTNRFSADILRVESIPRCDRVNSIRAFLFDFTLGLPKSLESDVDFYSWRLGENQKFLLEELEAESKVFDEVLT